MSAAICGGYILLSRKLIESEIMRKPPLYLKVWVWMLLQAFHTQKNQINRGQFRTSIPEIREAMSYYVGYRKVTPSKKEIFGILEWLRSPCEGNDKGTTIVTTKVIHGMVVTIENYDHYQNPKNYEGNGGGNDEIPTAGEVGEQYKEECKEYKKENTCAPTSAKRSRSKPQPGPRLNLETFAWEGISEEDINRWSEAYPACSIDTELRQAAEWIRANPKKAKLNWPRFITNWLMRSQDRGGTRNGKQQILQPKPQSAPYKEWRDEPDPEAEETARVLREARAAGDNRPVKQILDEWEARRNAN